MKKLIITRFLGLLVCLLVGAIVIVITYLLSPPANEAYMVYYNYLYYTAGMIPLCLLYFFAGRKCYDVSIKKLLLVFAIWTIAICILSVFVNYYLASLSGGFTCFSSYIYLIKLIKNKYAAFIIGFLLEMATILTGIFFGRIEKGKTSGKYVVFLSKFCGVIIGYLLVYLIRAIYVVAVPKDSVTELAIEGYRLGWIIAMLPVALWYIYAGYKSFRTNLKLTLPIFFLWNTLGIFLWHAFDLNKCLELCGGYGVFLCGMATFIDGKYQYIAYISAYILEALFITGGVLLGRCIDKKKELPEEIQEVAIAE